MKTLNETREAAPKMFDTENDIPKECRAQLIPLLNQRLASAVDLQMQMEQAHWNVKGPSFIDLHKLFDELAEEVAGYVDQLAERIAQLGGVAEGTVRMAASRTRLSEYSIEISEGMAHVGSAALALSTFGQEARETIYEMEDTDTADLFTEISRGIDKWLWFVEAHSQATK
jgi:starvation-inducible DNA-binding protein